MADDFMKEQPGDVIDMISDDLLDATEVFMGNARQGMGEWFALHGEKDLEHEMMNLRGLRMKLLEEEYDEYMKGERENDLVEIVDGLCDMIVIAYGTLLSYIGPEKTQAACKEVAKSNLVKVIGEGLPLFRDDGKVIKPEGWTPPDIKGAVWGS